MMAHILIVDDDEIQRHLLKNYLNEAGHIVFEASNGEQALNLHERNNIDIIITDILMPEKDGLELIIELRNVTPLTKLIAMTGGGMLGDDQNYLDVANHLGAAAVLKKPIGKDLLLEHISRLIF